MFLLFMRLIERVGKGLRIQTQSAFFAIPNDKSASWGTMCYDIKYGYKSHIYYDFLFRQW